MYSESMQLKVWQMCVRLTFGGEKCILSKELAGVAELADALDLGSSGRPWGFESLHPHCKSAEFTALFLCRVAFHVA